MVSVTFWWVFPSVSNLESCCICLLQLAHCTTLARCTSPRPYQRETFFSMYHVAFSLEFVTWCPVKQVANTCKPPRPNNPKSLEMNFEALIYFQNLGMKKHLRQHSPKKCARKPFWTVNCNTFTRCVRCWVFFLLFRAFLPFRYVCGKDLASEHLKNAESKKHSVTHTHTPCIFTPTVLEINFCFMCLTAASVPDTFFPHCHASSTVTLWIAAKKNIERSFNDKKLWKALDEVN